MQYRNIRVENLAPGVPKAADGTGPFTVTGTGPHTIEVRTIDAAGNTGSRSFPIEVGASWRRLVRRTTPVVVPLTPVSTIMPAMIDFPATFRLGTTSSKVTRATFARRGVTVPVACTGAMDGSAKLTVSSADKRSCVVERDARQQRRPLLRARTRPR